MTPAELDGAVIAATADALLGGVGITTFELFGNDPIAPTRWRAVVDLHGEHVWTENADAAVATVELFVRVTDGGMCIYCARQLAVVGPMENGSPPPGRCGVYLVGDGRPEAWVPACRL